MTIRINHAGSRVPAAALAFLASAGVVIGSSIAIAQTEAALSSDVVPASLTPGDIGALGGPSAAYLLNGDPGGTSTGTVGDLSVSDKAAGLVYAQLAVAAAGLLFAGTGAFLIANRAHLRDAIWDGRATGVGRSGAEKSDPNSRPAA